MSFAQRLFKGNLGPKVRPSTACVALILASTASCEGDDGAPDELAAASYAEVVGRESRLMFYLFDASDAGPGVALTRPASDRVDALAQKLTGLECVEVEVDGTTIAASFDSCSLSSVGQVDGSILATFQNPTDSPGDFLVLTSEEPVFIAGHSIELRAVAHSIDLSLRVEYSSFSSGVTKQGISFNHGTSDSFVDGRCMGEECKGKGVIDGTEAGDCLQVLMTPQMGELDGEAFISADVDYRKCAGQCPGGCLFGSCVTRVTWPSRDATIAFDGSATVGGGIPVDCSD